MPTDDRYQNQTWFVRRWRNRHYLSVPYNALKYWWYEQTRELRDEDDWRMSFKNAWGLAKGIAQSKMKYYWYWDEIKKDFHLDIDVDED
jgi:hypothetical protein